MLDVQIINPDSIVFNGQAEYILAPGVKGWLGIMPGHTPYFGELIAGEITLKTSSEEKKFTIEAGILKVRGDKVTILIGL